MKIELFKGSERRPCVSLILLYRELTDKPYGFDFRMVYEAGCKETYAALAARFADADEDKRYAVGASMVRLDVPRFELRLSGLDGNPLTAEVDFEPDWRGGSGGSASVRGKAAARGIYLQGQEDPESECLDVRLSVAEFDARHRRPNTKDIPKALLSFLFGRDYASKLREQFLHASGVWKVERAKREEEVRIALMSVFSLGIRQMVICEAEKLRDPAADVEDICQKIIEAAKQDDVARLTLSDCSASSAFRVCPACGLVVKDRYDVISALEPLCAAEWEDMHGGGSTKESEICAERAREREAEVEFTTTDTTKK